MSNLSFGETVVCKWKDNKSAAYSVGGDDSLRSQLNFAIPEMDRRGLRGNWWVNPGRGGPKNFKNQDDSWAECWIACYQDWKAAARRGHHFGNHTMHHLGAATYEEADREIGQTAQAIWECNPRQRLQLFLRGGGTQWGISEAELDEILAKYDCVQGRGGGIEDPTWETNPSAATLRGFVDTAIQEESWHLTGFHGIGPQCEWGGPVDGEAFIALLDYLVEKRQLVWCGTALEVHKYEQERSTAKVNLAEATNAEIRLQLTSTKDARLYDAPLTLHTGMEGKWETARVIQNGVETPCVIREGVIQYQAVPGKGEIHVTR